MANENHSNWQKSDPTSGDVTLAHAHIATLMLSDAVLLQTDSMSRQLQKFSSKNA